MSNISTVFFDAGNTFLSPCESIGEIYARLAAEIGYILKPKRLNARISGAWKNCRRIKSLRGFQCTNALLIEDWRHFVYHVLSPDIQTADFDKVFMHIYKRFGQAEFYALADGFTDTIHKLKNLNIHLGIISNWDNRLPNLLKAFDLHLLFDTLTISYEAGFEKPNPKIYNIACEKTDVLPENALMIGDSLNEDIIAPVSMGMTGILYDPNKLNTGWNGPILRSWKEPYILFELAEK